MSSPTQRSKKLLESRGYLVAIVERWNAFARRRVDLFGFIDILAIKGDETLAIQTTSGSNVSARITKINETQSSKVWAESPNRKIIVHGWAKRGPRGKAKRWECREIEIKQSVTREFERTA